MNNVVWKTTVTPNAEMEDATQAAIGDVYPVFVDAVGDAMGMIAVQEREELERQINELRLKVVLLEGKVEALMALMQGKAQVVDLPPLPKLLETSETSIVRKVRVS